MILMDSSGWVEIAGAGPRAPAFLDALGQSEDTVVPTVVVREVYRAVELQAGRDQADLIARYLAKLQVVPLDFDLAVGAARLARELGLALADSIIYATAQATGATVVTGDADFAELPQVMYIPLES